MRDPQISLRAHAVGENAPIHRRKNLLNIRIVDAQNGHAIERNFPDEFGKRPADRVEIWIMIEMLAIDIRHNCDDRRKLQK